MKINMKCQCGGEMERFNPARERALKLLAKHKPWSKNRRIARKQQKRFRSQSHTMMVPFLIPISGPGRIRCLSCGIEEGFMQAIGRRIVDVQPMTETCGVVFYNNQYKKED